MKFNKYFFKNSLFWLGLVLMASVLSLIPVFPAHSVCFTTLWWINVTEPIVGLILIVTSVLTKK
ncbi:hypothetical protein LOOC260_107480 [Paucilactobacillus hokkaidonensis JCM 18461]|uniref:Uncharacterized protein n=3 Tax=Paucilactobacillus hokkaidonensis TaxID=1193095 RepID=A0A0A1GWP4_9LACO|nr:hypothetical protein [Paucilactobacillus hokkaidonensis]KRO09300.1 hypothetical protein IV59_GL000754 [Paucilactobacillus hokkaidonensis]BAP85288.1 hypothetical protein LOOC260_107480 [Paucilactobacillus hokkaidonensis JCM 18461]